MQKLNSPQLHYLRVRTKFVKMNSLFSAITTTIILFQQKQSCSAFLSPSARNKVHNGNQFFHLHKQTIPTTLFAQKQTRSSLLKPPDTASSSSSSATKPKTKQIIDKDDGTETNEEVYGAKFFGGNAVKEELFDAESEEQADKLLKLYPPKKEVTNSDDDEKKEDQIYYRFKDKDAFPDEEACIVAQRLQAAINQALYISEEDNSDYGSNIYSSSIQWNTPFSKDPKSQSPIDELENALNFYKRIDVAIIAAKTISSGEKQTMEIRWEISLLWPNVFESRVLITGTSTVTFDTKSSTIIAQQDKLDIGGNDGKDIINTISSQVQPRFWDLYHIGMTPSCERMPRIQPGSKNKGFLSSYDIFEIPPRLVLQPTIVDLGGRETREAQSIPNHAFTSIIKTTGPTSQRYVTTSPVEVSIRRKSSDDGGSKSVISWNIPLPPEFISFKDEMPILVSDEDKEDGKEPTNNYIYQPRRFVATMKYGGSAQDVEVTDIRKKLYEQVVKDGLKPKLGDEGRPQFFFLQNDAKACFTGDGGLGMAVYEWRPKSVDSNEVGIELEL